MNTAKETKEIIRKLQSVRLCLMAHPDNEKGSEFEDRINDLEEIERKLLNTEQDAKAGILADVSKREGLRDKRLLFAWQMHVNELNGDKHGIPDPAEIRKFLANYSC